MKRLLFAVSLCLGLGTTACDKGGGGFQIPKNKDLKAGGVYVAYNLGCDKGCSEIAKGDLIQKVDGKMVKTGEELDAAALNDGQPHKLEILAAKSMAPKTVTVQAKPKNNMPPLKDMPPLWTVGADRLNQTPDWARRRMFGHASPSVQLMSIDGGTMDGRQLYGKKRFVVYWDQGDRIEQAQAVSFYQVLQKAQADLNAKGVEALLVQVRFPTGRQAALNDSDLRAWQKKHAVKENGKEYPPLPFYRFPNKTEFNAAREIGMENAFTVFENLGQSPTVILLDERGIVRWHSEGVQTPPQGGQIADPSQYTIIEAVKFALEKL